MPGARPITATGLAQPALEEAASEHDVGHQQTPEPAPTYEPEPVPSAQVRELIVATGADRLSAVDPAKCGWLFSKAKGCC